MFTSLILAAALPPAAIRLAGKEFVVQVGSKVTRVPVKPETEASVERVLFRKDAAFAVWDSRGLSVRIGTKVKTTKLPDVVLSPKLFSREEILAHKDRLASGEINKNAAGLSGALRVGDAVYFLVRWETRQKKPWLEALYKVLFKAKTVEPELVGRFEGLSQATKPIDRKLFLLSGMPCAITAGDDKTWGLSRFDPAGPKISYDPMGSGLIGFDPQTSRVGLFREKTTYGTTTLGRIDFGSGGRRVLLDERGTIDLLDQREPVLVVIRDGSKVTLKNIASGQLQGLKPSEALARAGDNVLIWSPKEKPSAARLLSLDRFEVIAKWTPESGDRAEPPAPSKRSRNRPGQSAPPPSHRGR